MSELHLTFQEHGLPISIARADGAREVPPDGVIEYVELAHGPWTLDPATRPVGVMRVDWPKLCDPEGVIGCPGTMRYVAHVAEAFFDENGVEIHPAGWECQVCCGAEVGGLRSIVLASWTEE